MTAPARLISRRLARGAAVTLAVTALTASSLATGSASVASPAAATHAAATGKPGLVAAPITLDTQVSFDGNNRAYDLATDRSGTAYVAWISSSTTGGGGREVHLCTLPLHATSCEGGVRTVTLTDSPTSAGLRLLVTPAGAVTILWYHTDAGGGEIAEATAQGGGPLSPETDVASAPINGQLLDAELAPNGTIWTVTSGDSDTPLEVSQGITSPATAVTTPYPVGYASLAFSGSTPIIAITKNAAITQPAAVTYLSGGAWKPFANVANTGTDGTEVGLTSTRSGVVLTTDAGNADYTPAVAKWNGHGFAAATATGDTCELGGHDPATDSSGRLADVSAECGTISVSNLADTRHASVVRFSPGGSVAGGDPQLATLPSGRAFVVWSVENAVAGTGQNLKLGQVLLPGLTRKVTKKGKHGKVTVTGPVSCMPTSTLTVGVKGKAKHGWKIKSHKLTLGKKKLKKTLNGASLTANKLYTLTGTVVFHKGKLHSTVKAKLKFRACPVP